MKPQASIGYWRIHEFGFELCDLSSKRARQALIVKAAGFSERGDGLGKLILETHGEEARRSHPPGGDSFDPRSSQMSVLPADRHILEEIDRGEIQ